MENDRGYSGYYAWLDEPGVSVIETTFNPYWKYQLQGSLSAFSWVQAGHECNFFGCPPLPAGYIAFAEATANAANTAGFYIEVLSPGASLTTASGATYAAPVPEPASAWMFGVGVMSLLVAIRQRRRVCG
jgi:hypothetical protein